MLLLVDGSNNFREWAKYGDKGSDQNNKEIRL